MANAYGQPLIIHDDARVSRLTRVALVGTAEVSGYDEGFVQRLAFEHPECLPIAEIDRAYEQLVPVCMELETNAGYLDALYVTPEGRLVILEAKLWRNPEARRKVVAQILDYARELAAWDYTDLQKELSRQLQRKGNVLFELVQAHYPDTDEAQFVDGVEQSLRRGRFLLLILGDGIREGAGAITRFLERTANLEFTFGLVELALYRDPTIGLLVQPRVITRSVEIGRTVVSLDPGLLVKQADDAERHEEEKPPTALQVFYKTFWTEFLEDLSLDDTSQPLPNPNKTGNIFFAMPPSGELAWVTTYFVKAQNEVGVFLTFLRRNNFGDTAYQRLLEERPEIDEDLGIAVTWKSEDGKHTIGCHRQFDDAYAEHNRSAVKSYLGDAVNRYVNVFRPRLERIVSESAT